MQYEAIYDNGNSGSSKTIDWKNGNIQKLTTTADCTLTISNPLIGVHILFIITGVTSRSVTWPANFCWAGGSTPAFGTLTTTVVEIYYDGSTYFAKSGQYVVP